MNYQFLYSIDILISCVRFKDSTSPSTQLALQHRPSFIGTKFFSIEVHRIISIKFYTIVEAFMVGSGSGLSSFLDRFATSNSHERTGFTFFRSFLIRSI